VLSSLNKHSSVFFGSVSDGRKKSFGQSFQSVVLPSTRSSSEEDLCQAVVEDEEKAVAVADEVEAVEIEVGETYAGVVASTEREVKEKAVEQFKQEPVAEQPIEEPAVEAVADVAAETLEEEEKEEEAAEIADEAAEPAAVATVATVSSPQVAKSRRRRGKRSGQQQSERQQRSAQLRLSEEKTFEIVKPVLAEAPLPEVKAELPTVAAAVDASKNDDQWEPVPPELKLGSSSEQWETSSRSRRSKRGGRQAQFVPQQEEEEPAATIEDVAPAAAEKSPEPTPEPVPEPAETASEPVKLADDESSERSASAPSSRRSTLKKQNRKKRPSLDDGSSGSGSSIRPVLIQDGLIDITAGGLLMTRPLIKRPSDILDEQALMIKDIGHGMRDGPITMGRFGLGKYTPPDRSDEILSSIVARQLKLDKLEEQNAVAVAEEEKGAADAAVAVKNHSQDLDLD
jgi:hypothetical protein